MGNKVKFDLFDAEVMGLAVLVGYLTTLVTGNWESALFVAIATTVFSQISSGKGKVEIGEFDVAIWIVATVFGIVALWLSGPFLAFVVSTVAVKFESKTRPSR